MLVAPLNDRLELSGKHFFAMRKIKSGSAVADLRERAGRGEADSQFILGCLFLFGRQIPKNEIAARDWIRQAANHGLPDVTLGMMYDTGLGTSEDRTEAVRWYRAAAEQGNALGQYLTAVSYPKGEGNSQDYREAAKWFHKAAEQGETEAQTSLAALYFTGSGVPQDYVAAHFWLNLAAASADHEDRRVALAGARETVARNMTRGQIAKAQTLAAKWRPSTGL